MRCAWCPAEATLYRDGVFLPICDAEACARASLNALVASGRNYMRKTTRSTADNTTHARVRRLAEAAARCADIDGPADTSGWTIFG